MIYSPSGGSDGIGFAIPAHLALSVMDQILTHGRVIRGWLGVGLHPFLEQNGLRITHITQPSPAAAAGLQVGDVLLAANDVRATNLQSITNVIANTPPGETLQLEILRDNQRFRAEATVMELRSR